MDGPGEGWMAVPSSKGNFLIASGGWEGIGAPPGGSQAPQNLLVVGTNPTWPKVTASVGLRNVEVCKLQAPFQNFGNIEK